MVEPQPTLGPVVRFGAFELDMRTGELRKSGLRVGLQDQPLQVLTLLLERRGELVTREELRQRLWPADTFVDFEQGLNAAVKRLRVVLGDSAEVPRFIETLPRRGYRWALVADTAAPIASAEPGVESAPIRRPFRAWWLVLAAGLVALAAAAILSRRTSPRPSPTATTRVAPLAKLSGQVLDYALSPDARSVAYGSQSEGGRALYVKDVGSGREMRIADGLAGIASPAWSPDGREIAFLRRARGSEGREEIVVVPAGGGAERGLGTVMGSNTGLDWSPGGRLLAFVDKVAEKGPDAIHLLDLETGERRRLTTPVGTASPDLGDSEPSFSPDGGTVAFIRRGGGAPTATDLYVHDVDSSDSRPVTSGYGARDVAWSPDGRALVFLGGRPQAGTLWVVAASGGKVRRVHGGVEDVGAVSLARGARALSFEHRLVDTNVWRGRGPAAVGHEPPRIVPGSPRQESQPDYSPDGTRLAFAASRGGGMGVRMCGVDGTGCVDFDPKDSLARPAWSPDGRSLAAVGWQEQDKPLDIYRLEVESRFVRRLTTDNAVDSMPSWSRDGRWLYFASDRSGRFEIWRMPSAGGDARQLTHGGGITAYESADGRWLYFMNAGDFGTVWRMAADGGEPTLVLDQKIHFGRWTLWRDRVVYIDTVATPHRAMMFDPPSRRTTHLFTLDRPAGAGVAVSPDGAWVAYTQRDQVVSEIMTLDGIE
jgi:Tol biopolymer transport system component/DNA-binding winged helix-turn-helix (wHTH) protein